LFFPATATAFVNSAFASANERTDADATGLAPQFKIYLECQLRFDRNVLIVIGKEEL
jgi:hypothetical protein